jgi:hypothetical protein
MGLLKTLHFRKLFGLFKLFSYRNIKPVNKLKIN